MTPGSYPTFTPGANEQRPGTITRQTGNWMTEGFTADSCIRVSNSRSNDGFWHISAVTATTLTVDGVGPFTAEAGDSAVTIEGGYRNSGNPGLTFASPTDANGSVTSTITRVQRQLGRRRVRVRSVGLVLFTLTQRRGAGDNDGDYVVLAVTATVLTVDAGPGLKDAGSGLQHHRLDPGLAGRTSRSTVADPTKQIAAARRRRWSSGPTQPSRAPSPAATAIGWAADLFAVGQLATIVPGTSDTGRSYEQGRLPDRRDQRRRP